MVLEIFSGEHNSMLQNVLSPLDPVNANTLETIRQSLFILCLDELFGDRSSSSASSSVISETSPVKFSVDQNMIAHNNLHGGAINSGNRWFDKSLAFVVSRDGGVGLNFEHTAFDGHVIVAVLEQALKATNNLDVALRPENELDLQLRPVDPWKPIRLGWNLCADTDDHLDAAESMICK